MSLMDDRLFSVLMCYIDYGESHPNHAIDSAWRHLPCSGRMGKAPSLMERSLLHEESLHPLSWYGPGALSPVALDERGPASPAPLPSPIQGQQVSISDIM